MKQEAGSILTDQIIVKRVLDGDTRAYALLIKKTEGLVAGIILRLVRDKSDHSDLAQDIYIKVYRNLKNFRFGSKLSTWIGQIAYNSCYNYLDKKKRDVLRAPESFDVMMHSPETVSDRSESDQEKQMIREELTEALRLEIEALPPLYGLLITLYHYEELSCAEIAEITGMPEGTVKSYLFRARKMLKEKMWVYYKDGI